MHLRACRPWIGSGRHCRGASTMLGRGRISSAPVAPSKFRSRINDSSARLRSWDRLYIPGTHAEAPLSLRPLLVIVILVALRRRVRFLRLCAHRGAHGYWRRLGQRLGGGIRRHQCCTRAHVRGGGRRRHMSARSRAPCARAAARAHAHARRALRTRAPIWRSCSSAVACMACRLLRAGQRRRKRGRM